MTWGFWRSGIRVCNFGASESQRRVQSKMSSVLLLCRQGRRMLRVQHLLASGRLSEIHGHLAHAAWTHVGDFLPAQTFGVEEDFGEIHSEAQQKGPQVNPEGSGNGNPANSTHQSLSPRASRGPI